MSSEITIVDRGRGMQLSTSRITVQDLVPYFQLNYSHEQILEIMPSLSVAEIEIVRAYVQDHFEEVMAQDRRIRERSAQRRNSPEVERIQQLGKEKMAALREEFQKKRAAERNGDYAPR